MSIAPTRPEDDSQPASQDPAKEESGNASNATQREPDPEAEPIPDGHRKFIPKSPFRSGNT